MKKICIILLLLCFSVAHNSLHAEQLADYRIHIGNTVEEYQKYVGRIITYVPTESITSWGSVELSEVLRMGDNIKDYEVLSISGKTKKGKPFQKSVWKLRPKEGGVDREIIVYLGQYDKIIPYYNSGTEIKIQDFPFILYDDWKSNHISEIGNIYTNPLVKANYKVVDVYLAIEKSRKDYKEHVLKMYELENSDSKERVSYPAETVEKDCFSEDIKGNYYSVLSKVEKPENPSIKYGTTKTIDADVDKDITKFSYIDNVIDIIIFGTSQRFDFIIKNVSENSIKIVWDDAVFVGINGKTSKVMHSDTKFSQRNATQPASTIIRGASLEEIACPTENVYYDDLLEMWNVHSMYPEKPAQENGQVQLMLPIQIKDVVNEYIFVFDVKYKYKHPERLNL